MDVLQSVASLVPLLAPIFVPVLISVKRTSTGLAADHGDSGSAIFGYHRLGAGVLNL